jgi:hypothetical protein
MAVRAFLKECQPELCVVSVYGPVEHLRLVYFDDRSGDFDDFVAAAYLIGLGIRATNEVDEDGSIGWAMEILTAEPFIRASADARAWPLPDGVSLVSTWTRRDRTDGNVVTRALEAAKSASRRGHWVRLHTFERGDSDDLDGGSTSEVVVDIFDCAAPPSENDSDEQL